MGYQLFQQRFLGFFSKGAEKCLSHNVLKNVHKGTGVPSTEQKTTPYVSVACLIATALARKVSKEQKEQEHGGQRRHNVTSITST